ncbi:hypothetical protein BD779DRAFT_582961 [Infundibulicybe gibba]|nr:hypothetical protein BD779DRAFT_582961 [Infundibulicybe gibba]
MGLILILKTSGLKCRIGRILNELRFLCHWSDTLRRSPEAGPTRFHARKPRGGLSGWPHIILLQLHAPVIMNYDASRSPPDYESHADNASFSSSPTLGSPRSGRRVDDTLSLAERHVCGVRIHRRCIVCESHSQTLQLRAWANRAAGIQSHLSPWHLRPGTASRHPQRHFPHPA